MKEDEDEKKIRTQREKNYERGSAAELVNLAGEVRGLFLAAWTPVFDSGFNPRDALKSCSPNLPQKALSVTPTFSRGSHNQAASFRV